MCFNGQYFSFSYEEKKKKSLEERSARQERCRLIFHDFVSAADMFLASYWDGPADRDTGWSLVLAPWHDSGNGLFLHPQHSCSCPHGEFCSPCLSPLSPSHHVFTVTAAGSWQPAITYFCLPSTFLYIHVTTNTHTFIFQLTVLSQDKVNQHR